MCFNKETSLIAFIIPMLFCLKLIIVKNDKLKNFIGLSSIAIIFIQLFEFFIWKYLKFNNINKFFSLLIKILLNLQPILFFIFYNIIYKEKIEFKFLIILAIYSILVINKFKIYLKNYNNLLTKIDKSGKLFWPKKKFHYDLGLILYFLIIIVIFYKIYKLDKRILTILKYYFVIFLITMTYIYHLKPKTFDTFVGLFNTLWCFSGVFIPIITLFLI